MTTTPTYLQENEDGCITATSKYYEMQKFSTVVADLERYAQPYEDEGTAFMLDGVLIDTDRWVHESSEAHTRRAILRYHETTEEEVEAWIEENPEVAYWAAYVGQFGGCICPELEEMINSCDDDEEDDL